MILIIILFLILIPISFFLYRVYVEYPSSCKKFIQSAKNNKTGEIPIVSSTSTPFFGDLKAMIKNLTGWTLTELQTGSKLVSCRFFRWISFVTDPKIYSLVHNSPDENFTRDFSNIGVIGRILVNSILESDGEEWKRQHRIMQKAFTSTNINKFFDLMKQSTLTTCFKEIDNAMKKEGTVDLRPLFGKLAVEIIIEAGFASSHDQTEKINSIFQEILNESQNIFWRIPYVHKLNFLPQVKRVNQLFEEIEGIGNRIIDVRRKKLKECNSEEDLPVRYLIDLLIEARDDETKTYLTQEELLRNVLTFLIAGSDTTGGSIVWFLHNLVCNPEIYNKVQSEIDRVVPDDMSKFTLQDISKLEYMNLVINESLRLNPPVQSCPARILKHDMEFGDWSFKEDFAIGLNILGSHLSPENFNEPQKFLPDRWNEPAPNINDEEVSRERGFKNKFVAFGTGRRVCIGKHFAYLEMKTVLCLILKKYTISPSHSTGSLPKERELSPPTIIPKGGLSLAFKERITG